MVEKYSSLSAIVTFLGVLLILFEIPLLRLKSKIKREYEDPLK